MNRMHTPREMHLHRATRTPVWMSLQGSRRLGGLVLAALLAASVTHSQTSMALGTNFWDMGWGNYSADPFAPNHNNVSGTNPWKPAFMEEIKIYSNLRFMDYGRTNNAAQHHTGRWADRVQKSATVQNPMAYEWMIDLCNRQRADMWVCVIHIADDDYVQNLAQLIYDQLDPSLQVWVEWSNETWNDMFQQAQYCQTNGLAAGYYPGNQWYAGQKYHAVRTIQVWAIFENVFSDARHRLVNVMGSTVVHAFAETQIECVYNTTDNPTGARMDALALAPYIGSGLNGTSPTVFQDLQTAIPNAMTEVRRVRNALTGRDGQLVCYEGGQHLYNNAHIASRDSRMYDIYRAYLDTLSRYFTFFSHYCHSGAFNSGGAWGSKEDIGQPIAQAHKYRALYDYTVSIGQYDPVTGERPVARIAGDGEHLRPALRTSHTPALMLLGFPAWNGAYRTAAFGLDGRTVPVSTQTNLPGAAIIER